RTAPTPPLFPYTTLFRSRYSRLIEHRNTDRTLHDLGFLFWPTWKRWYDLTGDQAINAVVIEAGKMMALRFNERGRYLRSFDHHRSEEHTSELQSLAYLVC